MKKRCISLAVASCALLLWPLLTRWFSQPADDTRSAPAAPSQVQDPATPPRASPDPRDPSRPVAALYSTPITFYGRVIDQNGVPVGGARVRYQAHDNPARGGREQVLTSTTDGTFAITGVRGISLFVQVDKGGYRSFQQDSGENDSSGSFGFGVALGGSRHVPDRIRPVTFVLWKIGELEPLLVIPTRRILIPKDGTSRLISLHPDRSQTHSIEVICRTDEDAAALNQPYSWKFEITAVNGEIQTRRDSSAFRAPASGYQRKDAVEMKAGMSRDVWQRVLEKSYFVRYADGVHARLDIEMLTGDQQKIVLRSWLNPKPGSRNLEDAPQ